ncbi:BTAD domain-containing putative transcriptional regulator [Actinoplanes subtropicus]|uniref:BTAD domain-containing putative transcriptional regulator n=1 Tax=Actinoplanes subtropicus TaxID=543632 RepID=UPI0012FC0D90|nr:BTAD domain-containing putative transcriptional regulator [Actinoplanes subtropicus]
MRFRILGDLEVRDSGGGEVVLPAGHTRAVLATLLLRANRPVATEDLIAAAWGEKGVSHAQLHKAASALRKSFGVPLKTHNRYGYELVAAEDDLDLLMFRRLVGEADERRDGSDAEIATLRAALALWRSGRPLSNVRLESATAEIEALRRQRKRAATRLFGLEIDRGGHAGVLEDLTHFATEFPDDTKLCALLLTALYRDGHVEGIIPAIERYEAASEAPDQGLRRQAYAMVRGDVPEPAVPAPQQLPPRPPYFVGRDGLLAEVRWLLREPRLPVLAITGPGGMGKTALALQAGHEAAGSYPDGQLWADLCGTRDQPADPAEVLAEFLRALGVPAVPETRRERAALYRSAMAGRRVLVLLDDAADGAQVRDLLPGGGRSVVLITARRRLPDLGAPAHHVAPLGAFDAVTAGELFHRIAADGHVDLAGEQEAVGDVVRLCGGLPLAVRMAALLRVESYHRSTGELLRRLVEQGPTAFAYGEESLARTLGAGLVPLDDRARRLFLGLGRLALPVFAEWTAAAVLDERGPAAGEALTQLAAIGMVDPVPGEARYRFHDLTRQYARGLADTAPSWAAGLGEPALRVCRALLTLTRHAHTAFYGGDFDVTHGAAADAPVPAAELAQAAAEPRVWFERERANIRAAVEQAAELGSADLCWDLAVSAHEFYAIGGYFDDWRATHEVALAACRAAGDRRGEGIVLTMLGMPPLVASGSAGVSGVPELQRAVDLLAETGDRHALAVAQRTLANALRRNGELARPLELFTEALAHYQESGDVVGSQQALRFVGQTHLDGGDAEDAVAVLLEAEKLARNSGQARVLAPALYWLAQAYLAGGDRPAAAAAFDEVQRLSPPDSGLAHAYALHGLGDLALAGGDTGTARHLLERAETLSREAADAGLEARVCLSIAAVEAAADRPDDRLAALRRAFGPIRASGNRWLEMLVQAELADAYDRMGDAGAARTARDRIAELYDQGDVPPGDRRLLSS